MNIIEDDGHLVVYPNPVTNGCFSIQGIENIKQVKVLNELGIQVAEYEHLNQSLLNIKIDVLPGIYIIRCFDGQRFDYRKILVK